MDTGSADHTARHDKPVHMSRSGSTRPFAPNSPMAKKLQKKEQEMLANWPTADEDPIEEIPPTEPRPTQLNFDSANAAPFENIANNANNALANNAPDHTSNAPAPTTALHPPQPKSAASTASTNAHKTPSYLQTATTNNALSLDTIIDTVLGSYECPAALLNTKIKSFYDVLADYSKRHPESDRAISPHSCSETLRSEFNRYYSEFRSRNQWLDEPATVALLAKIANLSPAARLIVQKAWMRSVGLSEAASYALAACTKSTGEMGDRQATYMDLANVNFDGLAAVTIEALCSTGSSSDATDQAVYNLGAMDVSTCRNLSQLLAMELKLWQACYRELDGPPMATYLRLSNLKASCERDQLWRELTAAFEDIISRDKKMKISTVKAWSTVESKMYEAWDLVCNQGILKRFEKQIDEDSSFDENSSTSSDISVNFLSYPVSDRGPKQLAVTLPIPPLKDVGSKDQSLLCKDCKEMFTDSKDDQDHRASRGWSHPPARCPPCKVKHLEALSKNPQPCADFKNGKCTYADRCRYSHISPPKLIVQHVAFDEEDEEALSPSDYDTDDLDLECY